MTLMDRIEAMAARHHAELQQLRSLALSNRETADGSERQLLDDNALRWPFARTEDLETRTRFEKQQERQTIRILGEVAVEDQNPTLSSSLVQYRFAFLVPDSSGGWEVDEETFEQTGPDVVAINLRNPETALTTFPIDTTGWIRSNNPTADLLIWEFDYEPSIQFPVGSLNEIWTVVDDSPQTYDWAPPPTYEFPDGSLNQVWSVVSDSPDVLNWRTIREVPTIGAICDVFVKTGTTTSAFMTPRINEAFRGVNVGMPVVADGLLIDLKTLGGSQVYLPSVAVHASVNMVADLTTVGTITLNVYQRIFSGGPSRVLIWSAPLIKATATGVTVNGHWSDTLRVHDTPDGTPFDFEVVNAGARGDLTVSLSMHEVPRRFLPECTANDIFPGGRFAMASVVPDPV